MTAENWLKILDPERISKSAARYHNKTISSHLIIITAPISPQSFFHQISESEELNQFMRRLSLTIEISQGKKERLYTVNSIERKKIMGDQRSLKSLCTKRNHLIRLLGVVLLNF